MSAGSPRLPLKYSQKCCSWQVQTVILVCNCEPGVGYALRYRCVSRPATAAPHIAARRQCQPRPRAFKCRLPNRSRPAVLDAGNCRNANSQRPWYCSQVINVRSSSSERLRGDTMQRRRMRSVVSEGASFRQAAPGLVLRLRSKGRLSFKRSNKRNRHGRIDRPQREKGCANIRLRDVWDRGAFWRRSRSAGCSPRIPSNSLAMCEPRALPPHLLRILTATSRNRSSGEVAPLAFHSLCSVVLP
jgi:hypothetical protein